jgi:hypothetical protein
MGEGTGVANWILPINGVVKAAIKSTEGFLTSTVYLRPSVDIYYQNVKGLKTKYVDFCDTVYSSDQRMICLTIKIY